MTVDLTRHQLDRYTAPHNGCYAWAFPNGTLAAVLPDPDRPLRWLLLPNGPGTEPVEAGLTSEQVEVRLAEIAAIDTKEH